MMIFDIITAIDQFLIDNGKRITTPVEVNPYLEEIGLLKDSPDRRGLPLRRLLRAGEIPHAYQIGNKWEIPRSGTTQVHVPQKPFSFKSIRPSSEEKIYKSNKLIPIAQLIENLLANKYGVKINYYFEYKPNWLLSHPNSEKLKKHWNNISNAYSDLIDNRYILVSRLHNIDEFHKKRTQAFDIWFDKPFNFAVEFDEKQHFNQFRKLSLDHYQGINTGFDVNYYRNLCNRIQNPGASGFTKLKSSDDLFPELLVGGNQDNRVRQRAFRDLLKDFTPISHGFNPTIRIPYHVTNKKIKDFDTTDLEDVKIYLIGNGILDRINI